MCEVWRAGPADAHALVPLIREFYQADRHEFAPDRVGRALAPLLADDTLGQVWLIRTDTAGPPQGYAVVTWGCSLESGGKDALLDEIFVRERGAGLGQLLLSHAMNAAAQAGASRMFLETESHNQRARGLLHAPRVRDRGLGLDELRADRAGQPPGTRQARLIAGRESLATGGL